MLFQVESMRGVRHGAVGQHSCKVHLLIKRWEVIDGASDESIGGGHNLLFA